MSGCHKVERAVASLIISHRRMLCGVKEEEAKHLIFSTTGSCLGRSDKKKPRHFKNHLTDTPSYYPDVLDCSVLLRECIQNPQASRRSPSECTLSL